MKIYALVIVCLLTGARNMLAYEGLETQDVVLAIERHSSRHCVPAILFVDNGTQLMALDKIIAILGIVEDDLDSDEVEQENRETI